MLTVRAVCSREAQWDKGTLMAKKYHWFRHYAKDYLGDPAIMKLSHQAKGFLLDFNSILWAHTDRQGYYVINGQIGTFEELLSEALSYSVGSSKCRRRAAVRSLDDIREAGHLVKGSDGIIYSKYLVSLIANSEIQSERGKKGGNPAITKDKIRLNLGLNPESESESELDKDPQFSDLTKRLEDEMGSMESVNPFPHAVVSPKFAKWDRAIDKSRQAKATAAKKEEKE